MEFTEIVFTIAEVIGTVAFAVSGAMIAIERGLDLFGVIFLAITTALGGGTIRDVLLGHFPPRMFYSFWYLTISAICAIVVFILMYIKNSHSNNREGFLLKCISIFDAIGLGVFSVIGVQVSIEAGFGSNVFLCIFLGMTTGCGGGMIRDLLSCETPYVLRKHIYASASIIGSIVFYVFHLLPAQNTLAIFMGAGSTIVIRMLATVFKWNLPKVNQQLDKNKTT